MSGQSRIYAYQLQKVYCFLSRYEESTNWWRNWAWCYLKLLVPGTDAMEFLKYFSCSEIKHGFELFGRLDLNQFVNENVLVMFGCCCMISNKTKKDTHPYNDFYATAWHINVKTLNYVESAILCDVNYNCM